MEIVTPNNEYFVLKSEISTRNANFLRELSDQSLTVTEHIRRATAFYHLAMRVYENGGSIYSLLDQESEIIPLFDPGRDSENALDRVMLSVNLNVETAKVLQDLGVSEESSETSVLDNVLHHYCKAVEKSKNGQKIIVDYSNGVKNELLFI